jgi:broad specificity phosphatase PhoE
MTSDSRSIVLIRHGETEWSRERRHTGRTDLPLTDEGLHQADELARPLAQFTFAGVLCSPRQRAMETCRHARLLDRAELTDDAVEWDYGIYEGLRTSDIQQNIADWSVWTHAIIDGETLAQVGARADRLISRALSTDGDVAIFSHAHLLRILAARWIGLHPLGGRSFVLDPASVSVLTFERDQRVIGRWNATDGPGGPTV